MMRMLCTYKLTVLLVLFLLALGLVSVAWAQVGSPGEQPQLADLIGGLIRVETVGGGSFQGTLLTVAEDRIEILAADGQILQISRKAIRSYQRISPDAGERALYQDSASNRLMVMPTAFAMAPGEFHVADQEIIVVTSSYGLTENITLWGGISIPGALLSARFVSTFGDSFGLSAGSFAGVQWIGGPGPLSGLLMPYALSSWGEPNNNLTVGAGVPFSFGPPRGFDTLGAVGAIGGKSVLTSTTALVTENWVIWGKRSDEHWDSIPLSAILGLAFRIAGSRFSWDIGGVLPLSISRERIRGLDGGPFVPLPWVSLTYRI
ncbi:MAG: hypothetical protein ACUVXI_02345 [bacterium]